MTAVRNIVVIFGILGVLLLGLWHVFVLPGQVEERFREFLGRDGTETWAFRGLSQEGLNEFYAERIIIPAEPVYEQRDLSVFSRVKVRSGGPFIPSLSRHALSVRCEVGEVNLEVKAGKWNCAVTAGELYSFCEKGLFQSFECTGVLHLSIRRMQDSTTWTLPLTRTRLEIKEGGAVRGTGRLGEAQEVEPPRGREAYSWLRGEVKCEYDQEPRRFSLTAKAERFRGLSRLLSLFAGDVREVQFGGEGSVTLSGALSEGEVNWEGKLVATDFEIGFPFAGIFLRHLVGPVGFSRQRVEWEGVTGTTCGFHIESTGKLSPGGGRELYCRVDFPSVALSRAWPRLVEWKGLRRLFRPFPPSGVLTGTLSLEAALLSGSKAIFCDFFGKELSLGNGIAVSGVRAEAELVDNVVSEGELTWEGWRFKGGKLGRGGLAVEKKGKEWLIRQIACKLENGELTGEGRLTGAVNPFITLTLRIPEVKVSWLFKALGAESFPSGYGQGDLQVKYGADGVRARSGGFELQEVGLGAFLGKASHAFPEGTDLNFQSGRASFQYREGWVFLKPGPAVFISKEKVLALAGSFSCDGKADLMFLYLQRDELTEQVLYKTPVDEWPLSGEQRSGALCFSFNGFLKQGEAEPLEMDQFLDSLTGESGL